MNSFHFSQRSYPSQKSLTFATNDSQGNISTGSNKPANHKRFTRKNTNMSAGKKNNNTSLTLIEDEKSSATQRQHQPRKFSSQKSIASSQKIITPAKDSRRSLTRLQLNQYPKTNNRKTDQNRSMRQTKFDDAFIISEEKHTSRNSGKSIDSKTSIYVKDNTVTLLKTQLQLKKKELIAQEEQTRKFRNHAEQLKVKEYLLQQQIAINQSDSKQLKEKHKKTMKNLEKKLEQSIKLSTNLQNQNQQLSRQLASSIKQLKILQQQLKLFIDNQIPKNILELQSCRQVSLQQTIQQLKYELNKNKTDLEKQMEIIIQKLKTSNLDLQQQIKNYQIINRLLLKKSNDSQRYLQSYNSIKIQLKDSRKFMKQLREQCELLRKQNVRIKKQIRQFEKMTSSALTKKKNRPYTEGNVSFGSTRDYTFEKTMTRNPSEAQSLTLSISQC